MTRVASSDETTWLITNAVATVTHASTIQTMSATAARYVFAPTGYHYNIGGGSIQTATCLGGTYTFATTAPLEGDSRRLPHSGELLLSTSAGSRAKIVPPTTPGPTEETVELAVAATGAAFATTRQTVWTEIIRGWRFSSLRNVRPVITGLQILPANANPGDALTASFSATDANRDSLQTTIEWRRNGAAVAAIAPRCTLPRNPTTPSPSR